ncbi:hypothetical protein ACFLZB_04945 [Nanoarchaeota archaeon]
MKEEKYRVYLTDRFCCFPLTDNVIVTDVTHKLINTQELWVDYEGLVCHLEKFSRIGEANLEYDGTIKEPMGCGEPIFIHKSFPPNMHWSNPETLEDASRTFVLKEVSRKYYDQMVDDFEKQLAERKCKEDEIRKKWRGMDSEICRQISELETVKFSYLLKEEFFYRK